MTRLPIDSRLKQSTPQAELTFMVTPETYGLLLSRYKAEFILYIATTHQFAHHRSRLNGQML